LSQVSLFRSLLYQILDKNRALLPIAFPKRWESYDLCEGEDDPLSWAERPSAIKPIANGASRCYCFLVDVLDEFDGDPAALVRLITVLRALTSQECENVRIKPSMARI
jgi:hypothetical protein